MDKFDIDLSPSSTEQATQGTAIDIKDVKPGDLVFFKRKKGGRISHVAMVFSNEDGKLEIIHSTSRGVVIDELMTSKYWRPKISHFKDVVSREM